MPTETTVLHSSEETTPITDNLKKKLQEEFEAAQKDLAKAEAKAHDLADSEDAEAKGKALEDLEKAKAKVEDLKSKMIAAGMNPDEGTPTPVVPGSGAVESPTTGAETHPAQPKEDEGHKPAPSTGGTETQPVPPTPAVPTGSEEGHGTTETHEGTPAGGETHTETPGPADHLEDHAAHAEEGKHEENQPSADEAALKAKAEEAKAKAETAKTELEKAKAKVEELAKDEHASEEDRAKAAKALVEAKAKVEETTKEAAKAEAAANPANKLGGVAFALASGAYRML